MSSTPLIFAALALLCAAGALWILQRGAQRKGQVSTARFIDSRMAQAAPSAAHAGAHGQMQGNTPASTQSAARGTRLAPSAPQGAASVGARLQYLKAKLGFVFTTMLGRAGVVNPRGPLSIVALVVLLLCFLATKRGGVLAGGATLCACAVFIYFVLSMRAQKRRQQIVRQVPLFLDGIVRLITLGNSVPAAFQASLQTTEAPLRECLDQVSRMLRTGVEIDRALSQAAALYRVNELELVGAVLRLSVKYGGRADVMLDRMSAFMRDLEQAERELVAMSAETRLSSWVLALLPVGIAGFLIVSNPQYFGSMWYDPTGRLYIYLAFGLQMAGAYALYRLTRLRT
ncbi:MAG TPA: type II secretion system F family protein [Paraburkholderia sp.]|jgi:tight adherence protein B|nr:type II secretion system F family protein [Paraburkholderia sp.]